jgi:hypothetical protein
MHPSTFFRFRARRLAIGLGFRILAVAWLLSIFVGADSTPLAAEPPGEFSALTIGENDTEPTGTNFVSGSAQAPGLPAPNNNIRPDANALPLKAWLKNAAGDGAVFETAAHCAAGKDFTAGKDFAAGSLTVRPYGILWGDMIFASSRATPGPFVLWIDSEQEQGESTWIADARRSRVGIDVSGGRWDALGGLACGGKVEIDFFDTFVNENQPGLRLRHVYWEAKNDELRLLVGQTWDVVSPLRPNTVNFSVGWAAGNIGFRRTQFRVERFYGGGDGGTWSLQGVLAQNIVPDLASGPRAAGVSRETGNWPMIQARLGYQNGTGHGRSAAFGISGHVGETGFDFTGGDPANPSLGPEDDARFFEWSFNTDARLELHDQLRIQSEFFMGSNLSNVLGGIGQGVCPCLRVPIRSIGGWAEVSYDLSDRFTTNVGFGIDDPREADSLIGRTYNRFVYANLFWQLTEQLRTGIEVSDWRTSFHNRTDEPGFNAIDSPDRPGKATVVDFTVQYQF